MGSVLLYVKEFPTELGYRDVVYVVRLWENLQRWEGIWKNLCKYCPAHYYFQEIVFCLPEMCKEELIKQSDCQKTRFSSHSNPASIPICLPRFSVNVLVIAKWLQPGKKGSRRGNTIHKERHVGMNC